MRPIHQAKAKYIPKAPQTKAAILVKSQKPMAAAPINGQKMLSEKKRKIKELAAIFVNGKMAATANSPKAKRFQKDGTFILLLKLANVDAKNNNKGKMDKEVVISKVECNKYAKNNIPKIPVLEGTNPLWEKFKNDDTQYELSDRSNDTESDIDENYDSIYFSETEMDETSCKASAHTKRLVTRKKKCIAKWAEDKASVNRLLAYQQRTMNPDLIFGRLSVDNIRLSEVFGNKYNRPDFRGSSANWKNENWTPIPSDHPPRRITRDDKDHRVENLDQKFVLSQACVEEVLAKDEADSEVVSETSSSYDFSVLQVFPSWQENKD